MGLVFEKLGHNLKIMWRFFVLFLENVLDSAVFNLKFMISINSDFSSNGGNKSGLLVNSNTVLNMVQICDNG